MGYHDRYIYIYIHINNSIKKLQILLYKLRRRSWVNPSCTDDGKCVRVEEIFFNSITNVVKRLPHFSLRNNTFGLHFFYTCVLECTKRISFRFSFPVFFVWKGFKLAPSSCLGSPDTLLGVTYQGCGHLTLNLASRPQVRLIPSCCKAAGCTFGRSLHLPWYLLYWILL